MSLIPYAPCSICRRPKSPIMTTGLILHEAMFHSPHTLAPFIAVSGKISGANHQRFSLCAEYMPNP